MVLSRWLIRGISVISTVILVRLLDPEDFGLLAMSTLFIALLEVLTSFGVDMALIQRKDASPEHFNTAWTIRILQGVLIALAIFLLSPTIGDYFDEPRVVPLAKFLSCGVLIASFENIGIVNFRKELHFSQEFQFMVLSKVASFTITISLVMILRNYWALAWGIVGSRILTVALSYKMHSYRPRLSLTKISDIWSFSQWMLLRNVGMYLRKQIDSFFIARNFSTEQMGFYGVAKEVADLPTTDLVWPMARAIFPGFVTIANDPARLGGAYLKVLSTIALISIPTGVGIALVADSIVLIFFGERWHSIAPTLSWLSVYGAVLTISATVQSPLMALGLMRRVAILVWTQLLVIIPVFYYSVSFESLETVAFVQFASSVALLPIFFWAIVKTGIVRWAQILSATSRSVLSGAVMFFAVSAIPEAWFDSQLLELATDVAVGAIVFTAVNGLTWYAAGRPDGGEQLAFDLLIEKLVRDRKG